MSGLSIDFKGITHMDKILEIIKIIAILQGIVIASFIALMYLAKLVVYFKEKKNIKKRKQIHTLFEEHFKKHEPLSLKNVNIFKHSIQNVLIVLKDFDTEHQGSDYLELFKSQLSASVFKPVARKLTESRHWFKRYTATLCYLHGFDDIDEPKLIKLLDDSTLLVAINAGMCVLKYNNSPLINAMITSFAASRRLQQSAFAEIFVRNEKKHDISEIVLKRLETESDVYVKIFCYRLLTRLPQASISPSARRDLHIASTDLRIAVIEYISHTDDIEKVSLIYSLVDNPDWEIRASIAKALGNIKDDVSTQKLSVFLNDSKQWVRINAAKSLSQHGEPGMKILRTLSPENDKFAYETAKSLLMTMEKQ